MGFFCSDEKRTRRKRQKSASRSAERLRCKTVRSVFAPPHDATRLGESGAEAFTIQKIAGRSSAVISQRYLHPTPALIESAFSRFEAYNAAMAAELDQAERLQ
jgi:hypothetical protein